MKHTITHFPIRIAVVLSLIIVNTEYVRGQQEYTFEDNLVEDCKGFLSDSDLGNAEETVVFYEHNEDYTFSICPPGADVITITFQHFCTEASDDVLSFYDGPDTSAPLITAHSGTVPTPFSIPATSGCLTMHFSSDGSIACSGWEASWDTEIEELPDLDVLNIPEQECYSTSFTINSDSPILCESVAAEAFDLTLYGFPIQVISATALECDAGLTETIQVDLADPLDQGGPHLLSFDYVYVDVCGEEQSSLSQVEFNVVGCPLEVEVWMDPEMICEGSCGNIQAQATGGDSNQYVYTWSDGIADGAGPHAICPAESSYTVTVFEAASGSSVSAVFEVEYLQEIDAGEDVVVCQEAANITLYGDPIGGTWSGPMMNAAGVLNPSSEFSNQQKWVYYKWSGCVDSLQVTVLPGFAGHNKALCPGSDLFQFNGSPVGGVWSGSEFISEDGLFDPAEIGTHEIYYTAENGCVDVKEVFVQEVSLEATAPFCQSDAPFNLQRTPYWGGTFGPSPGLENSWQGQFNAAEAGPGVHMITYTLGGGCADTIEVEVLEMSVPVWWLPCPEQGLLPLPEVSPAGGVWTSTAADSAMDWDNLLFDTGYHGGANFGENLIYTYGSCYDTLKARIKKTDITKDTLQFCINDSPFTLNNDNVGKSHGGGTWTGPGIVDGGNHNSPYDPALAGPGVHTIYYHKNDCTDSVKVFVYDPISVDTIRVCSAQSPFDIPIEIPEIPASSEFDESLNGQFEGDGILNVFTGTFDPSIGQGTYSVNYHHFDGCSDQLYVIVEPVEEAELETLAPFYCFADTSILLSASPVGGSFSGPGVSQNHFNPELAGEGFHVIRYDVGEGECASSDDFIVKVGAPITVDLQLESDSICFGHGTTLTAIVSGGSGSNYNIQWQPDLGSGFVHYLSPEETSSYTASLSDGCSLSDPASITLFVHPQISYEVAYSELVCSGEIGSAQLIIDPSKDYSIDWESPGIVDNITVIEAQEGQYKVSITDILSNCSVQDEIDIPAYDLVSASFDFDLKESDCYSRLAFDFVDRSIGARTGTWDFGDGTTEPYIEGLYPNHVYQNAGDFEVTLIIENEGGCWDKHSEQLCIKPKRPFSLPNAFSPNGDGVNDLYRPFTLGVTDLQWQIFDRWGKLLFESAAIDGSWNGRYKNEVLPSGVYVVAGVYQDMWNNKPVKFQGNVTLIR